MFDCMVFIQAVASRGPAYQCYQIVTESETPLLMSLDTLEELRAVLTRPELRRKLPGLTEARVSALLYHLENLAWLVDPVEKHIHFPPDPKDEPYVNLAIQARAADLVTRDRALLRLADPLDPLVRLIALHPALRVLPPESFLETNTSLP